MLSLLCRRWGVLALTIVAVALADLSASALKGLIDRPRPPLRYPDQHPHVQVPDSGSFPSGHAATSFAGATILAFAFPRGAPMFYLLATAVGFSRVYLGVHYPLDVLGGAVLGTLIALALRSLVRRWQRELREGANTQGRDRPTLVHIEGRSLTGAKQR